MDWSVVHIAALASLLAAVFVLLIRGVLAVMRDTRRRSGHWGVNTQRMRCPRCHMVGPLFRIPKNRRQALWGGYTCRCGCEIDKWGREVS